MSSEEPQDCDKYESEKEYEEAEKEYIDLMFSPPMQWCDGFTNCPYSLNPEQLYKDLKVFREKLADHTFTIYCELSDGEQIRVKKDTMDSLESIFKDLIERVTEAGGLKTKL